ncbi:MAG: SLC13 family permease [Woeseiaceae bacterium]|nr:SLC13 family permease [Woeseiaceae bacterium]
MALEPHALATILLSIGALVLFSRNEIPLEYSCIAILIAIVLLFELFPLESAVPVSGATFLRGFGNEALITICLLLVLAKGVEISGALHAVGKWLSQVWLGRRKLALLATLVFAAFTSAFANNTPIVVMMLPILVGVAHRVEISPSKILMPVGFATIIGGMSTTIGTSTNLLIVSVSEEYGLPRLQMFDFIAPAALAAIVGLFYLWLLAPKLLPTRPSLLADTAPRLFNSVVEIGDDRAFEGKPLSEIVHTLGPDVRIVRIERSPEIELVRLPTLELQVGDKLQIRGTPEAIHAAQRLLGSTERTGKLTRVPDERVVEVVVTRDSPLHGKKLSQAQRTELRDLTPIGWYRPGVHRVAALERLRDPRLRNGDVLLMQGPRQQVNELIETPRILILARTIRIPRSDHARLAIGTMVGVVLVAALGLLPILTSALLGVGVMLAGRCLTWDEAWSAIDLRIVLVIVASLALGTALTVTGAAQELAVGLVAIIGELPPPVILSGLLLMTALLTEVVTNNAIAVIATPIAISISAELGMPALPFVLAVLFGANMSYLTPIGYQTNLLVMAAGGYHFSDFFRAGLPLQLLLWLTLSVALWWLYL